MPKYVIEREIPGAGQLSADELRVVSQKSVGIIDELGHGLVWLHSYVTDDRIYCVYESPGPELILEHARCLGVPATRVVEVRTIISPATATS